MKKFFKAAGVFAFAVNALVVIGFFVYVLAPVLAAYAGCR